MFLRYLSAFEEGEQEAAGGGFHLQKINAGAEVFDGNRKCGAGLSGFYQASLATVNTVAEGFAEAGGSQAFGGGIGVEDRNGLLMAGHGKGSGTGRKIIDFLGVLTPAEIGTEHDADAVGRGNGHGRFVVIGGAAEMVGEIFHGLAAVEFDGQDQAAAGGIGADIYPTGALVILTGNMGVAVAEIRVGVDGKEAVAVQEISRDARPGAVELNEDFVAGGGVLEIAVIAVIAYAAEELHIGGAIDFHAVVAVEGMGGGSEVCVPHDHGEASGGRHGYPIDVFGCVGVVAPSIREAARGEGLSVLQVQGNHVHVLTRFSHQCHVAVLPIGVAFAGTQADGFVGGEAEDDGGAVLGDVIFFDGAVGSEGIDEVGVGVGPTAFPEVAGQVADDVAGGGVVEQGGRVFEQAHIAVPGLDFGVVVDGIPLPIVVVARDAEQGHGGGQGGVGYGGVPSGQGRCVGGDSLIKGVGGILGVHFRRYQEKRKKNEDERTDVFTNRCHRR